MTTPAAQQDPARPAGEFTFATALRAADRERVLVQLVAAVWDSILNTAILARDTAEDLDNQSRHYPLLSGSVRISGAWKGSVVMCVPFSLAREAAAHMYGRAAEDLSDDDVRDAWGELVNVVGGNLKALLPPPSQLALPEVQDTLTWTRQEAGATRLNEVTFACLGERVRLTLFRFPD
ncbi:MAG TPA: chemotaxis protein CheX [Gemmatimonadales bacterium]|jgi:chemotaxis protein CheX